MKIQAYMELWDALTPTINLSFNTDDISFELLELTFEEVEELLKDIKEMLELHQKTYQGLKKIRESQLEEVQNSAKE